MSTQKRSERSKKFIKRLEKIARDSPEKYEWRVLWLMLFGYAYPIILCAGVAILSWNINSGIRKYYAFIIVFVVALQILFIGKIKPQGIAIERKQYPVLFEELDRIQQKLKTPRIHSVLLTENVDAAMLQSPRLGIFGWNTNYLILGVPLMNLLSPEQFRAILAHELGHLSGNHSKISVWIYQQRRTWEQFAKNQAGMQNVQDISTLLFWLLFLPFFWLLFLPFFKWYRPFFDSHAFALSRNHEYLADRDAASYAGKENIAEGLISLCTRGTYVTEKYWQIFFQKSFFQEQKPERPISNLIENLKSPVSHNLYKAWLKRALAEKTNYDDTHPCLAERLEMYDYKPYDFVPESLVVSAAEYFLGDRESDIIQKLDEQSMSQDLWEYFYKKSSVEFNYFDEISRGNRHLTPQQAVTCSNVIAFKDIDRAVEILFSAKATYPSSNIVICRLGELLLQQQDARGIEYIKTALYQRTGTLAFSNLTDIYDNLYQMNYDIDANFFLEKYRELINSYEESSDKLTDQLLRSKDLRLSHSKDLKNLLLPHNLPEYEIRQISSFLKNYLDLSQAFLVKIPVRDFSDASLFLLGLKFKRGVKESKREEICEKISSLICLGGVVVLPIVGELRKQLRKIKRVEGACIFKAS